LGKYLAIAGLEEVEPFTDVESSSSAPTSPDRSKDITPTDEIGSISSAEPETSMELQNHRLGWVHELSKGTAPLNQEVPIMLAEIVAAIYSAINLKVNNLHCYTDNMATRAFLRRGTARFLYVRNLMHR
jgi:hypothetical protein